MHVLQGKTSTRKVLVDRFGSDKFGFLRCVGALWGRKEPKEENIVLGGPKITFSSGGITVLPTSDPNGGVYERKCLFWRDFVWWD